MFDKLFKRPDTVEVYSSAPLANERLSFLHHLRESGSGATSLRHYACSQLRLVRLLDLTDRAPVWRCSDRGRNPVRLRADPRFLPQQASAKAVRAFVGDAVRWMRFLGRLQEPEELRHPMPTKVDAWGGLDAPGPRALRGNRQYPPSGRRSLLRPACSERHFPVRDHHLRHRPDFRRMARRETVRPEDAEPLRAPSSRFLQLRRIPRLVVRRVSPAAIMPPRVYPESGIPRGFARDDVPASPGHDRGGSAGRHPRPGPAVALHCLRSQGRGGRRTAAGRRRLAGGDALYPLPEAANHSSASALAQCRERAPALSSRSPPPTF